MAEKENRNSIQVIERMMQLLDALVREPGPTSLKYLARITGLHPPTAHQILSVMVDIQIAERVEVGSYRLGIRLLELGNLVKARVNVRQESLPYMRQLQQKLGETVNFSVRQMDEVVYVERAAGAQGMMRVVQVEGARAPLHITAVGKIFLAAEGVAGCKAYAKRNGLRAYTANTITSQSALLKEIGEVTRLGYAFDNEEAKKGVSCIGAGIFDDDGKLVAGLSVSAPSDRLSRTWAQSISETALRISRAMGYRDVGSVTVV